MAKLPPFLASKALEPFINAEGQRILDLAKPIRFITPKGSPAYGYRAELLPEVCKIYVKAREARGATAAAGGGGCA